MDPRQKTKLKTKPRLKVPGTDGESDPPNPDEYGWLNGENAKGNPENPEAIPPGIRDASELGAIAWVRRNCKFARGLRSVLDEFELSHVTDEPYEVNLKGIPQTLDEYAKHLNLDLVSLPPSKIRELETSFEKIKALKEMSGRPISEQELDEETVRDMTRMVRETPSEPSPPVQVHPGKQSVDMPSKRFLGRPSDYWTKGRW